MWLNLKCGISDREELINANSLLKIDKFDDVKIPRANSRFYIQFYDNCKQVVFSMAFSNKDMRDGAFAGIRYKLNNYLLDDPK